MSELKNPLKLPLIQKGGTEADWSKATNFIPYNRQIIIYDPDDTHSKARIKIGDGKTNVNELPFCGDGLSEAEVKKLIEKALDEFDPPESVGGLTEDEVKALITAETADLQPTLTAGENITIDQNTNTISATIPAAPAQVLTEETVKLANDLYTYVNIGKVTGSNTKPGALGKAGDSLKTVFNNLFGTQQDTQPTVTNNSSLSVDAGTTFYGGGEYGTAVSATDVTITFTLSNNSGTANYGYRYKQTKVTGSQTFYYPIIKQEGADIKIILPKGATATAVTDMGTLIKKEAETDSATENILYYDFNADKKVQIKISLEADTVGTTAKTRYDQISALVKLGSAQIENKLTAGTAINAFLTFLENDATDTTHLSGGNKTGTAGAYTIAPGSKYTYYAVTNTIETPPTSWTKYHDSTGVIDLKINANEGQYIWIASTSNYSSIYEFNEVSGSYNTDPTPTVKTNNNTITNAQGVSADGYYFYRIVNPRAVSGESKFKLA